MLHQELEKERHIGVDPGRFEARKIQRTSLVCLVRLAQAPGLGQAECGVLAGLGPT